MAEQQMTPGTIFPTEHPEYGLSGDALRGDQIREGGTGTAPAPGAGMKRYPTEPPTSQLESRGRTRGSALRWSALGALVGAATVWMVRRVRS